MKSKPETSVKIENFPCLPPFPIPNSGWARLRFSVESLLRRRGFHLITIDVSFSVISYIIQIPTAFGFLKDFHLINQIDLPSLHQSSVSEWIHSFLLLFNKHLLNANCMWHAKFTKMSKSQLLLESSAGKTVWAHNTVG